MVDYSNVMKASLYGRTLALYTSNEMLIRELCMMLTVKTTKRVNGRFVQDPLEIFQYVKRPDCGEIITLSGLLPKILKLAESLRVKVYVYEKKFTEDNFFLEETPVQNVMLVPHTQMYELDSHWDSLRDWQKEAIQLIANVRYSQIKVSTGGGKSYLIAKICKMARDKRICVTTGDIADMDNLYRAIAAEGCTVSRVTGQTSSESKQSRVLCVTTRSLHHVSDIKFDILIGDEVHSMAPSSFRTQLWKMTAKQAFGFSANIGDRADKADAIVEGIFGPCLLERTYKENQEDNDVVPIYYRMIETQSKKATQSSNPATRQKVYIVNNDFRNQQIVDIANHYISEGKQVLIMTNTVEHVLRLWSMLPEAIGVYRSVETKVKLKLAKEKLWSDKFPMLYNDKELRRVQDKFASQEIKLAIANSVWHKGKDFPALEVLIRADATSTKEACTQIGGRLSRTYPGKTCGILVDCKDSFDKSLSDSSRKRVKYYEALGWRSISNKPRELPT